MAKKWFSKLSAFLLTVSLCSVYVFAEGAGEPSRDKLLVLGLALIALGIVLLLVINAQKHLASMRGKHVSKHSVHTRREEPEEEEY